MTATVGDRKVGVPSGAFRTDIEGLRGVAVALVVLYHAGVPFLAGGYVGVDVFFVLSGFLITGLLLDERESSGRVRFANFYARRIRRLLPASVLVFVVTAVASRLVLNPVELEALVDQARWVALYAGNIWFAVDATDYLRADVESPFQQYWSLAVEEQFYLVWPALLVLAARWRRGIAVCIAVAIVASFTLAVVWTARVQPWAFFLLPARTWEMAAGGALALAMRRGWSLPAALGPLVGWLGAGFIIAAAVVYDDVTPFPGVMAAVPVVATMAVLASGVVAGGAGTAWLTWRPLRWLGEISYSLYLWHWPLLVLFAGESVPGRVTAVIAAVVVSWVSYHLVERRARFAPVLMRVPRLSYVMGAGVTAVALASTLLLVVEPPDPDEGPDPVPAGERSPYLPAGLTPEPSAATNDHFRHPEDRECNVTFTVSTLAECTYGTAGAAHSIVLVGDSHAGHWLPALHDAPFEVRTMLKTSCPPVEVEPWLEHLNRPYSECVEWRAEAFAAIEANPPDTVVMTAYSAHYANDVGHDEWIAGMTPVIERLSAVSDVVFLAGVPPSNGPKCVVAYPEDVSICDPRLNEVVDLIAAERAAVEAAGGRYVDTTTLVCPEGECRIIEGDILAYYDKSHLTATFVGAHSRELLELLNLTGPA